MSIKVMTLVWDRIDLSQSETLVALALADHADENGLCWPSLDRIAEKARISRRQTQRVIQKLEERGMLSVDRGQGRKMTSRYRLTIKGDTSTPFSEKGDMGDAEKVTSATKKGDTAMSPESSITIKEPSGRKTPDWSLVQNLNLDAWSEWIAFRRAEGMPRYKTDRSAKAIAKFSQEVQRSAIDYSMDNRYQGLMPEKFLKTKNGRGPGRSMEQINRMAVSLSMIRRSGETDDQFRTRVMERVQ